MKKILFGACVLAAMLSGCSSDSNEPKEIEQKVEEKTFTALANGATKVAWHSANDLSWELTDDIEAFDNSGHRLTFNAQSVDGNSASFSATGTLNNGSLAVFSPAQNLSGNTYTIDATGQTQSGNGSFAHLKDYTYMLGSASLDDSNTFAVGFSLIMAQLKWTIDLPTVLDAANVAAVKMKAASADAFKSAITYTVVDGVATAGPGTPTNEVGVAMTNMAGATSPIEAYMLAIPTSLSNETLEVLAENAAGDVIAYQQYTGVNVNYLGGQIYKGGLNGMTAVAPSTSSWDTDNYVDQYGVGTTTVREVASDDGASTVHYININGDNPQDFTVVTNEPDGPYLEVDGMNTNNAFVLNFPIYETAAKYKFTFEIKNLHSTADLTLKLQHKEAAEDKKGWVDINVTKWQELDPTNGLIELASGTTNNMTVSNAGHFEHLVIEFEFSSAEQAKYNKKNLQIAVDKTNKDTHDIGFKLISMEVMTP